MRKCEHNNNITKKKKKNLVCIQVHQKKRKGHQLICIYIFPDVS
jgi:hypothetical protein